MRAFVFLGFVFWISACSSFEPMQASCLNGHASPNYGEVKAIPGGFEVAGSGHAYTTIEITQPALGARPGTAGDPADDYPKSAYRTFACRTLDE